MPLNDLSLQDLRRLSDLLLALNDAGEQLAGNDLAARFDLTPGEEARITVGFTIPAAPAAPAAIEDAEDEWNAQLGERLGILDQNDLELYADHEMTKGRLRDLEEIVLDQQAKLDAIPFTPSIEAAPDLTQSGDVGGDTPEPVETPPAPEGQAGGDPIPSVAESSAADTPENIPPAASLPQDGPVSDVTETEGSGGGAVMAAAEPPAAPSPGSASALAAAAINASSAGWTEAEDKRLVNLVATAVVRGGLARKAAIAEAARELGRPEQGTQFRVYHKVKARIDAAITALAMDQAATEIPETAHQDEGPAAEPLADVVERLGADASAPVTAAGAGASHKPEHIADEVTGHLMALPDKGGWTVARDLELMELSIAGWQPNEIALQLTVQANQIKPRFDALTGLYEDAAGKKVRRFTREQVFAALERLAGKAA